MGDALVLTKPLGFGIASQAIKNEALPDPELAEAIMGLLIRASLTHQEQTRVAAETSGAGKRVLIIGGAGKMGAWFSKRSTRAMRRRERAAGSGFRFVLQA